MLSCSAGSKSTLRTGEGFGGRFLLKNTIGTVQLGEIEILVYIFQHLSVNHAFSISPNIVFGFKLA